MAQGDLTAALAAFQSAFEITDRLAKADPGNAQWQRDLSIAYERIGSVREAQGDLQAALASFQAELSITDRLAKADPGNTRWQQDLANGYDWAGDAQRALGDLNEAASSYQSGIDIRTRLAKADPANAQWQRSVSLSYNKLGNMQLARDDVAGALASYQAMLAIAARLAQSDPTNAGWQRDASIANEKVGEALFDLGKPAESLGNFNAAVDTGKVPELAIFRWRRAVAELYANAAAASADDAAEALRLRPSSAYYPVWLHLARLRAGQRDADEFAANAARIDRSSWPWPIVALFLGSGNPDEIRKAVAASEPASVRAGRSCAADFYQSARGAQADARELFQSAVDHCPHDIDEYWTARLELEQQRERTRAQAK
jgi:lipoprotein NlpI